MSVEIPFEYFYPDRKQEKEFRERRWITVSKDVIFQKDTMLNIGSGSMIFETEDSNDPETLLWMRFSIPGEKEIFKDIVGQILRCTQMENEKYQNIVRFVRIREKLRENIQRWIFNTKLQRKEERKKKAALKRKKIAAAKRKQATTVNS